MKLHHGIISFILMGLVLASGQDVQASAYGEGAFGECPYEEDCTVLTPETPTPTPKSKDDKTYYYANTTPEDQESQEEVIEQEEVTDLPPTVTPNKPSTNQNTGDSLGIVDKCYQWTILGIALCWYWWIVIGLVIAVSLLIVLIYQGMKEDKNTPPESRI